MRRLLVWSIVLAGCSFSGPAAIGDDGGGDDAGIDPDAVAGACNAAPTWEVGVQPARTLHVSTSSTGSGTPDGSMQDPYPTLADAVTAAKAAGPGTRILLAAGTYDAGVTVSNLRGTAAAPFWIEGPATAPRAVLDGEGVHLIRPAYVVLRHLDIRNAPQAAVNADDGGVGGNAHHVVVDDVAVTSAGTTAFQITGVTDVTIRDSAATSCNRAVMLVGVQQATVTRLRAGSMGFAGVVMTGGSRDITVRQSRFASISSVGVWVRGSSDSNEFRPPLSSATGNFEVTDVRLFDNVLVDLADAITCNNCRRVLVAHNEIRGATRYVFRLVQDRTAVDGYGFGSPGAVRWIDNAIDADANPGALDAFAVAGGTVDLASCVMDHNLWYKTSPPAAWTPNLPPPLVETMGIYTMPSGYDDDGKLCAGGAAGAGVAVPEVTGTIDGACRPSPPSIGPGERAAGC